jgi:thioredoxin 1
MMAGNIKELDDSAFDAAVEKGVALVDFWAPWCGPCLMQGPIVEKVASEIGEKALVAKVNVDEAPRTATKFAIRSIPTLLVLKDGEIFTSFVGVRQAAVLVAAVEAALA